MDNIAARYLPFLLEDDRQLLTQMQRRAHTGLAMRVVQLGDAEQALRRIAAQAPAERDAAVGQLVALVRAVDDLLLRQAELDADRFADSCNGAYAFNDHSAVMAVMVGVYRWRHIVADMGSLHFMGQLAPLLTAQQMRRVAAALEPMMASALSLSPAQAEA